MIPEVMSDPRLDLLDKLLLSYIYNWEEKNLTCYAKNDFFAKLYGVSEDSISFALNKLDTLGLLELTNVPGGRSIKSKKLTSLSQPEVDLDIFEI